MLMLFALACSTETPAPSAKEAAAGAAHHVAILEKADAHDGKVDKVVQECTGCGLGMMGDPAHASQVEGYTLHFCSETCQSNFDADPDAGLARLGKQL